MPLPDGPWTVLVKVGRLYVRDYPVRRGGGDDFSLTPNRSRAALFHVTDVPAEIAAELTVLGVRAEVVDADEEGRE